MIVAYLPHAFDMFNVEHVDLVEAARSRADWVVLAVLTDDDVFSRHGRSPVVPLNERLEIARHVRGVDEVLVHDLAAVPAEALVMVAAEEAARWPGAEVLPQVRTSASAVLRHALRDVASGAVA